jgi:hypothetical protein
MTGRKKKPFGVDELWQVERIGGVSLSPDGAQAVCSVGSYSMADNKSARACGCCRRSAASRAG